MIGPLLPVGAFVWCRFPLSENPRNPGPDDHLHLVYIADAAKNNVLTIYTTSVSWDPKVPTPIGVMIVKEEQARALGQKPFVLDARRIALLPLTTDWFPGLLKPDRGILKIADKTFQKEVAIIARAAAARVNNIEFLGPQAPVTRSEWKPPGHR